MKQYKAIIFDMDGTVLDTLDELTAALAHVYKGHQLPVCSRTCVRACLGYGYTGLIQRSAPQLDQKLQKTLAEEFKNWYSTHCQGLTHPYDGIPELLASLKTAGRKTAIVSNKGQAAVTSLHKEFFSGLVSFSMGESPKYRKKPAPDMVQEALKRLGCSREDAVYIGDSEVDLQTGRNAGLDVILVTWGFRDKEFLQSLQPDALAETPHQLQQMLFALPQSVH